MINLEVKLPDAPGSLIELIKPISANGGNIFGILHHHDKKINNMIPVSVNFELTEELREVSLKNIRKQLGEKNILIDEITFGAEKRHLTLILTGHVFDTDVLDTIKRLASRKIKVSELEAKFTDLKDVSTVKFKVEFPESVPKEELINEFEKICEEKNLYLIRT